MEETENKEIEKRKSKISEKLSLFFKEKENKILVLILIFALILQIFFFVKTINQPLWWDEAEYLSTAKHWALNTPYQVAEQRQPLLPLLLSFFYKIGISNLEILKFIIILIPSILCIYLIYLLGKEIYSKKVGLIAAFILTIFSEHLFWSSRFSTDIMGLLFGLLTIYFFWTGYEKTYSRNRLMLAGLFLALGLLTRIGNILVVFILLIYLIITKRFNLIKDKRIWLSFLIFLALLVPYLIWNYIVYQNPFAFWGGYFGGELSTIKLTRPIPWNIFSFFILYNGGWILFIFFIIGLYRFSNLFVGFDLMIKEKNKKIMGDLLIILIMIIPFIFFLFFERSPATEPRWLMLAGPAIFYTTARGLVYIYNIILKYNKQIAIGLVIILLLVTAYSEVKGTDNLIKIKKDSYKQVKEAGLWIKDNSNPNDIIISNSIPQNSFYSERKTIFTYNETRIKELKPKYFVVSIFENSGGEYFTYPQRHNETMKPIQIYFLDQEQKQPALVIYEFTNF